MERYIDEDGKYAWRFDKTIIRPNEKKVEEPIIEEPKKEAVKKKKKKK